ncbi:hypothetical protein [Aureivirga marina]|uniref:hypothetical protein n=1 Tax=Aureivirga marina TaxID=1182451 RepID=UPI0018CBCF05|nr:hypothetical protein [Aureivirga marina]
MKKIILAAAIAMGFTKGVSAQSYPELVHGDLTFYYDNDQLHRYGYGFYNEGTSSSLNAYMSSYYGLSFFTENKLRLKVLQNGNVGIGTSNPKSKLSIVKGNLGTYTDGLQNSLLYLNNGSEEDGSIVIKSHNGAKDRVIGAMKFQSSPDYGNYSQASIKAISGIYGQANTLAFFTAKNNIDKNGEEAMRIEGKIVKIGNKKTTSTNYRLSVEGTIISKEVIVDIDEFPDYVFEKNYDLPTLMEVKKYIKQNGHLRNIPSAKEVKLNGVKIAELNKALVEKVEELTLYTIQQEEKISEQKELNKQLQLKVEELEKDKKRLEDLEKRLTILENKNK